VTANSKIEWTDHTFNPWWGCVRVSPGCEHCYAETFAKRVGQKVWGVQAPRRFFGDKHWAEPLKWNREAEKAGERRRVFCASMADVFEDRDDLEPHRQRLFRLIEATPHLDWLILTKRPDKAVDWFGGTSGAGLSAPALPNLWMGTTAEDQKRADERIPLLLHIPAAVHFVSYEPALEAVDFSRWVAPECTCADMDVPFHYGACPFVLWLASGGGLDWLIVGGESGPGARPFDPEWARSVVNQCNSAGVACFVKQMGARPINFGRVAGDSKGGDMANWPEHLRVRQFPEARA
jgi:protein gp37